MTKVRDVTMAIKQGERTIVTKKYLASEKIQFFIVAEQLGLVAHLSSH